MAERTVPFVCPTHQNRGRFSEDKYVVYHYSDGNLEYEEHFNATGTLQEVLKYLYDADGNMEYLLYKNDSFSTTSAYDLYYYVRNATGDVTDLIQVLAKSTNYNTVVNRLAAHYEYDPYGNILSVDTYNNDNIGNINPIRYKDYYYDLQTGWYQLGSRFYDPEVGRFLNADDVSLLMETDSGVVDKNLYAYCDGNPVMRKDSDGEFWHIVAGAVIGAAFEAASQLAENGKITSVGSIVYAAGVGALTAAAPMAAAPLISGVATFAQEIATGSKPKTALVDAGVSASLSLVCGGGIKPKSIVSSVKTKTVKSAFKDFCKTAKKWQVHIGKEAKWKSALSSYHNSKLYSLYHSFKYYFKKK